MGSKMTSNATDVTISIATIEKIKFQIEELERNAKTFTEEVHGWMRSQGFDPERSLLVLPVSWQTELPQFIWPKCVRFSDMITAPVLMRDMLGLNL